MAQRTDCNEVPIFCGLVVEKAFDPDASGPPSGEWVPWNIDYAQYAFNPHDPQWHRTPGMDEMHAYIPTAAWPAIGDPHGRSTGEREVAPA